MSKVAEDDRDGACTGAREALAHVCQGEPFDIILCDLMMPEMTGMEFFAELQRHHPAQAEGVLFLTGGALTEAAGQFLAGQGERVLRKPIDMDFLREQLRAQLERRALSGEGVPRREERVQREGAAHASLSRVHAAR